MYSCGNAFSWFIRHKNSTQKNLFQWKKTTNKSKNEEKSRFYGNECVRNGRNKIFLNERKQWQTAADYSPWELPNKPMSSMQTNEKNSLMKIRIFFCWRWRRWCCFVILLLVLILEAVFRFMWRKWCKYISYGKWETFIVSGGPMCINRYIHKEKIFCVVCWIGMERHPPLSYELSEHSQRYLSTVDICPYVCVCVLYLFALACYLFFCPSIPNLHFMRVAVRLLLLLLLLLLRSLASWFINPNNILPLQNALYKSILQHRANHARFYYVLLFHHQEIMLCLFSSCRLSIYAKKKINRVYTHIHLYKKRLKYFFWTLLFRLKLS